jgi:hypothetical protein
MMAMEAMPTPAAVKPLVKREADFSARPNVRFGWRVQLIAATHSANFSAGV